MEKINPYQDDSEYIIIPNPIYDVVFKFLMEDVESATIVLSMLIGENIIHLQMEPTSHSEKKSLRLVEDPTTKDDVRLFHLDFTATVRYEDNSEELIMIELQKASEPDDIFRFKRYISKNFQKHRDVEIYNPIKSSYETVERPIRLIPIFILNFRIEKEINDLLIRANRVREGIFTNKTLKKNEFIDHLSYDMYVVQLPNLHKIQPENYENDEYKKKLFSLLKIFDQKSRIRDNEHRLRLIRRFFPGFLDRVIKRLQAADISNPDLEQTMYD